MGFLISTFYLYEQLLSASSQDECSVHCFLADPLHSSRMTDRRLLMDLQLEGRQACGWHWPWQVLGLGFWSGPAPAALPGQPGCGVPAVAPMPAEAARPCCTRPGRPHSSGREWALRQSVPWHMPTSEHTAGQWVKAQRLKKRHENVLSRKFKPDILIPEDMPWVVFMYFVFGCMPEESCCRWLRSLLLCWCDSFWGLIYLIPFVCGFQYFKSGP